jgi:hypothetical protein
VRQTPLPLHRIDQIDQIDRIRRNQKGDERRLVTCDTLVGGGLLRKKIFSEKKVKDQFFFRANENLFGGEISFLRA